MTSGPAHLAHLVRRFAGSVSDRPPTVADEVWADDHLNPGERRLWTRLGNADRRHALAVARRFVELRPNATRAEVAGVLLHDVGKLVSGLSVGGRVAATVAGPRTKRWRAYHDHEALGAELCARAGSDPVTVDLVAGRGPAEPLATLRAADDL